MRRLWSASLPCLALAALSVVFLYGVTHPDSRLNIHPDNESLIGPMLASASRAFRASDLPLWMNTAMGGLPLYNSPQLSPYYPLYFAWLDVFATPLETIRTLHRISLVHVVVFEITTYVLLRTLRISRGASILGVVFIAFSL